MFDTDDTAYVDVVAIDGRAGTTLFHSETPSDKGSIATGDGRYGLAADSDFVVVLTAPQPIPNVVGLSALADDPGRYADAVRELVPGAGITVLPRPRVLHVGPFTFTEPSWP